MSVLALGSKSKDKGASHDPEVSWCHYAAGFWCHDNTVFMQIFVKKQNMCFKKKQSENLIPVKYKVDKRSL